MRGTQATAPGTAIRLARRTSLLDIDADDHRNSALRGILPLREDSLKLLLD